MIENLHIPIELDILEDKNSSFSYDFSIFMFISLHNVYCSVIINIQV